MRVTWDGLGVHGSMFLAIDGDITAVEARFLGRLAGVGFCARRWREVAARWKEKRWIEDGSRDSKGGKEGG